MRKIALTACMCLVTCISIAQHFNADSLQKLAAKTTDPARKYDLLSQIIRQYYINGSGDFTAENGLDMVKAALQLNDNKKIAAGYNQLGDYYAYSKGDNTTALDYFFKAIPYAEKVPNGRELASIYTDIGVSYEVLGNYDEGYRFTQKAEASLPTPSNPDYWYLKLQIQISYAAYYALKNDAPKLLVHIKTAEQINARLKYPTWYLLVNILYGAYYAQVGEMDSARNAFSRAVALDKNNRFVFAHYNLDFHYIPFLIDNKEFTEAYSRANQMMQMAVADDDNYIKLRSSDYLREIYEKEGKSDSAYYFAKNALALKDTILQQTILNKDQALNFNEQVRKDEEAAERKREIETAVGFSVLVAIAIIALLLYRNSLQRKKANNLLSEQKEEIEAQRDNLADKNRELEIETALEKVRTVALAMQQPDDMLDVCRTICMQLVSLGVPEIRNVQTAIIYESRGIYMNYEYYRLHNKTFITEVDYSHPIQTDFIKKMLVEGTHHSLTLDGKELKDWFEYQKTTNQFVDANLAVAASLNYHWFSIGPVALGMSLYAPISEENLGLFKRFLEVFRLAYRRYKDIEQALEQARESQIQLALERVRARTMGMQKSDELAETVSLLFKQLLGLGIKTEQIRTCGIVTFDADKPIGEQWITETNGEIIPRSFMVPYDEAPAPKAIYRGWKKGEEFMVIHLEGQALKEHLGFLSKGTNVPTRDVVLPQQASEIYNHVMFFSRGCLFIITKEALPEYHDVFKRFGAVFRQSYTRFLDLQKAEAQAREGQIQLALERVRARTMAMQHSDELLETSALLSQQFYDLGTNAKQISIGIINEERGVVELSATLRGVPLPQIFDVRLDQPMMIAPTYKAWKEGKKSLELIIEGEQLREYNKLRSGESGNKFDFEGKGLESQWIVNAVFFSHGVLTCSTDTPVTEETRQLLARFGSVFEQTYTRFLDLQKAEQQAREAQIEAGLERVRSRTLAMQSSDELAETAAVVFRQLINLGIEPNRLFIGIIKDESGDIELWATDEDGSKVSTRFTGNANGNKSVKEMYDGWKAGKSSITIDMEGKVLKDYFHYLTETLHVPFKFGLDQKRRIQSIAYFSQGFIGMASPDEQPHSTTELLERFAGVFNLTYTRFNDLQVAEAHAIQAEHDLILLQTEKKRAEDALTELKATQTKLIQTEKMASLGELTAGIAHEIQNPLNFVNNFSEVSVELLQELKDEAEAGNIDDVMAIADDLTQNLGKINHHGKRADSIVKGMLEHSRVGTGEKQLTSINIIADEFLKLSYHGLRAKDKSFNAELITHFDETLPNVNIAQQDIGRVLLNLFNNAFYAVSQKQKTAGEKYKPEVTVSTSAERGKLIIKVKDNGNGIPDSIKDKIMQPFFTTKPTGEGTGLGLSLSYDIVVKGHGGSISVETEEGEFTEFTVTLPFETQNKGA